ncbi:MAG TPA: hypothetical protein VF529_11305 [Solirubrobacteraceae bacterium]|jgi:hypothetical protein
MTTRHILPLLLMAALALPACGGDDSDSDSGASGDAAAVYDKAVKELDTLESGRFDAQLDTELQLNDQTINVGETGSFAEGGGTKLPQFDIEIKVDQSGGESQQTSAIHTGEEFFVKQNGADEYEPQGASAVDSLTKTYAREQEALGDGRLPLLSLTPGDWAKSPKIEGTEDLGGVKVQRIVADLDVPAFLKDLETGKNSDIGMGVTLTKDAAELKEPGADTDVAKLVAWVGEEDGRLRRLTANVEGNVGGGVKVDFDVQLTELGESQEIEPPVPAGE